MARYVLLDAAPPARSACPRRLVGGGWLGEGVELVKPRAIRPGDCIGIVSTSSPVSAEELNRLVSYLEGRGYRVRLAEGVGDRAGHLAGTAVRRAAGVMSMFADPDVALVLPATGGTGASHVVDLLDYGLIRANPKVFTGFSDPSSVCNAILAGAGLPNVHGVTGIQFFEPTLKDEWTEDEFWAMVSGPITGREIAGSGWRAYRADQPVVSGPVVGGTLPSFRALVGTRWMPPTNGAILVIEAFMDTFDDVDRALTHLKLAGVFDGIAALVIGAPADWEREDAPDASTDELILRCVPDQGFPVITNVDFGHAARNIQLPIGCRVEFDLGGGSQVLRYLEDLVVT
jgi:muramoyltetrapeptide carboxypeptidase